MNEQKIKELLYQDFLKWYKINYWNDEEVKPKEKEVKQYLGYFGIHKRNITFKDNRFKDIVIELANDNSIEKDYLKVGWRDILLEGVKNENN